MSLPNMKYIKEQFGFIYSWVTSNSKKKKLEKELETARLNRVQNAGAGIRFPEHPGVRRGAPPKTPPRNPVTFAELPMTQPSQVQARLTDSGQPFGGRRRTPARTPARTPTRKPSRMPSRIPRRTPVTILERPVAQISLAQSQQAPLMPPPFIDESEIGVKWPSATLGPGTERRVWVDPEWKGKARQGIRELPSLPSTNTDIPKGWTPEDQSMIHPAYRTATPAPKRVNTYEADNKPTLPIDEDDNSATLPVDEDNNKIARPVLPRAPRQAAQVIRSENLSPALRDRSGLQATGRIQELGDAEVVKRDPTTSPRSIRGRTTHGEKYEYRLPSVPENSDIPLPLRIKTRRNRPVLPVGQHQSQVSAPHQVQDIKDMDFDTMRWPISPENDCSEFSAVDTDGSPDYMGAADSTKPLGTARRVTSMTYDNFDELLLQLYGMPADGVIEIYGGFLCDGKTNRPMSREEFWKNFNHICKNSSQEVLQRDRMSLSSNDMTSRNAMEDLEHPPAQRPRRQPPAVRTRSPTPPGLWGRKPLPSDSCCPVVTAEGDDWMIPESFTANSFNLGTLPTSTATATFVSPFDARVQTPRTSTYLIGMQIWVQHKDTLTGSLALVPDGTVKYPGQRTIGYMRVAAARRWLAKQHRHMTPLLFSHEHLFLRVPRSLAPDLFHFSPNLRSPQSSRGDPPRGNRPETANDRERTSDTSPKWFRPDLEMLSDSHPSALHSTTDGQVSDPASNDDIILAHTPPPESPENLEEEGDLGLMQPILRAQANYQNRKRDDFPRNNSWI